MEDEAILKEDFEWDDVFLDEDFYTDEKFSKFLEKTKENLANLSLIKNLPSTSEDNTADIEFMNFLDGLKEELSKRSEESASLSFKSTPSSKIQRSQSYAVEAAADDHIITEKRTTGLPYLQKIENKLNDDFKRNCVVGAKKLYKIFNEKIFEFKLPEDMELEWSVHLQTTAGKTCALKKGNRYYSCKIILSTKVLNTFERLRDTLLHEMCHAAVFLISQVPDEGHGPLWKTWAVRCKIVFPDIEMPQRCHTYDLSYPFFYQCNSCKWKCGRHRKTSKLSEKCCPKCRSSLSVIKF